MNTFYCWLPDILHFGLLPFHDWCKQALPNKRSSSFFSKQWNQINGIYMHTHHCKYFVFDGCQFKKKKKKKMRKKEAKGTFLMICVENSNIFLGFKLVSIISLVHFFLSCIWNYFLLFLFFSFDFKVNMKEKKIVNKML